MPEKILSSLLQAIDHSVEAIYQLKEPCAIEFILSSAQLLAKTFQSGHQVLIAGNGGSLCDAMHFAEELTGFFRAKRRALPAIALSDPGHLTCVSNDLSFAQVFARSIEAFGRPGDLFIGLTTSGNSANIIHAFAKAKELGLTTIAFLGKEGGQLKGVADLELIIRGFGHSDRIQEAHMTAIHLMIEQMENLMFPFS